MSFIYQKGFDFTPTDICERKHRSNPASVDAFKKGNKTLDEQKVLWIIKDAGWVGTHSKAIARKMGKPLNAISGRISDLKAKSLIYPTGERKEGCEVVRAK